MLLCQLLVAAGNLWRPCLVNASLSSLPPSSDPSFLVSVCGLVSSSYNDTSHMGLKAHPRPV